MSCYSFISAQYNVPEPPSKIYPVYDEVGLLNATETEEIKSKTHQICRFFFYRNSGSHHSYDEWRRCKFCSDTMGEKWKIGEKEQDNGVVFLIATEDRKMSIQQGRGVEQYLTASVSGQILDYLVTPNFKKGNGLKNKCWNFCNNGCCKR